jgi:hypothetical protein
MTPLCAVTTLSLKESEKHNVKSVVSEYTSMESKTSIDSNVIQPKTIEKREQPVAESNPVDKFTDGEMELYPLKKYFDVEMNDTNQDKYMEKIMAWAKDKGITDRSTLNTELRHLEMKLGAPDLGEKRSLRLSRYLDLDRQANQAIKEMNSYLR